MRKILALLLATSCVSAAEGDETVFEEIAKVTINGEEITLRDVGNKQKIAKGVCQQTLGSSFYELSGVEGLLRQES